MYKMSRTIYDKYETPVEYITIAATKEDELELTPFIGGDKVIEHVVLKDEITKKDIAKAISDLSADELEMLSEKIITLASIKKEKKLKLERDVA